MTDDVQQFVDWVVENHPNAATAKYSEQGYRIIVSEWIQSLIDGGGKDWQMEAVG